MWRTVVDEIRHLDTGRAALRSFGLVVGGVFVAIATFIAWRRGWDVSGWPLWLGIPGAALMLLGVLVATILRPAYLVWMGLAFAMGFVMTRVILTLVFVLLVIPIGLILRAVGKDVLDLRLRPEAPSYWRDREEDRPLGERIGRLY
jgi:hypothetical protein